MTKLYYLANKQNNFPTREQETSEFSNDFYNYIVTSDKKESEIWYNNLSKATQKKLYFATIDYNEKSDNNIKILDLFNKLKDKNNKTLFNSYGQVYLLENESVTSSIDRIIEIYLKDYIFNFDNNEIYIYSEIEKKKALSLYLTYKYNL